MLLAEQHEEHLCGLVKARPLLASFPLLAVDPIGTRGSPAISSYVKEHQCNEEEAKDTHVTLLS